MDSIVVVKVVMPEESLPQGIEGKVIFRKNLPEFLHYGWTDLKSGDLIRYLQLL